MTDTLVVGVALPSCPSAGMYGAQAGSVQARAEIGPATVAHLLPSAIWLWLVAAADHRSLT